MTTIFMEKIEDSLHPVDAEGIAALRQVDAGAILTIKFSVPRNVRQLRLYFAMLKLLFQNQQEPAQYATTDAMREGIDIALGHCHEVRNARTGEVRLVPNSISFGAMDQLQWTEYFTAWKNFVSTVIQPRVNKRDFDQAIADMLREPGPDQMWR